MKHASVTGQSRRRRHWQWHDASRNGGWYLSRWGFMRFADPAGYWLPHAVIIDPTLSAADREVARKAVRPGPNHRLVGLAAGLLTPIATVAANVMTGWPTGWLLISMILLSPVVGGLASKAVHARTLARARSLPNRLRDRVISGGSSEIMAAATRIGETETGGGPASEVDTVWAAAWDDLTRAEAVLSDDRGWAG